MFTFAAFKSRKDALSYAEAIMCARIPAKVISTPSKVGSSCGLSVKFHTSNLPFAQRALSGGEYPSLLGFFRD